MAVVTLMSLIRAAGFSGAAADTMYGIVMAESGGNPGAHNGNAATGDDSYGLAQINMIGALGPDRRQRYGLADNAALFDPSTNLRVAYSMSQGGTNFHPWSTFNSGAYLVFANGPHSHTVNTTPVQVSPTNSGPAPYPPNATPQPPYTAPIRKVMAAWIIQRVQSGNYKWNPKPDIGTLQQIAQDGGQHGINDARLRGIYVLSNIAGQNTGPTDVLGLLGKVFTFLTTAHNWVRIGLGALGVLAIVLAVLFLFRPEGGGNGSLKTAALTMAVAE